VFLRECGAVAGKFWQNFNSKRVTPQRNVAIYEIQQYCASAFDPKMQKNPSKADVLGVMNVTPYKLFL